MRTARAIQVRDNFKEYCDVAHSGEPVYVFRKDNKNVVIVSEAEYEHLMELKKIEEIEAAVLRAEADREAGRVYTTAQVREKMRTILND